MISEHASPLAALGGEDSGGQNVYVAELARWLGAMGHEVDVFTRRESSLFPEVVPFGEGVRVVHLSAGPPEAVPKDGLFPLMDEFRDAFYRFVLGEPAGYDLVHANFWMSGWVACEAKQDLGLPFAQTFHALGEIKQREQGAADTSPADRRKVESRILDEADKVLATCPAEVEDLVGLYGAEPSNLSLVPCGVHAETFRPVEKKEACRRLGLPDKPTVVYVGRLVPRKGVDTLVRAFALLPEDLDARLVVVGGEPGTGISPEAKRLAGLAGSLGVRERVTFAGSRPQAELRLYYGAGDVAVTVPHYEPFGMTPLEAMACAVPVVGARVGGIKTSVADGETGYLVPPKDPEALAGRLARLLCNGELRTRMGRAARRRIEEYYTWERVATLAATAFSEVARGYREAKMHPPNGTKYPYEGSTRPMMPDNMTFDLSNQVALVTGAGSGLGAATARLLAENGARVVLADVDKEAAGEVASEHGGRPLYMDLTDPGSIEGGVADVLGTEWRIDVLVNAAGLDFIRSVPELTLEEWDNVVGVNLRAPWLLAKAVMPHMTQRGSGQILNVASTAAKKGWENAAAYAASKHGLLGLTQVLHAEGRNYGVRAMVVVPGGMRTNFFAALDPPPPPENLQPPETVARSILFMISQPLDSVIHELIVTPMTETSYP